MLLSPIQKAAEALAKELPADDRVLSDEAWRVYRFQTEDLAVVKLTIARACELSQLPKPSILSAEELICRIRAYKQKTATTEQKAKASVSDTDILDALRDIFLPLQKKDSRAKVFVCLHPKENHQGAALDDTALRIMRVVAMDCAERRMEHISNLDLETKIPSNNPQGLSNNVFFALYGSPCSLPGELRDAMMTITYPCLTPEDFGYLLQEFDLRNQQEKKENGFGREPKLLEFKKHDPILRWYANRMAGLDEIVVRRLLRSMNSAFSNNFANYKDLQRIEPVIIDYKNRILKQHNRLEVISERESESSNQSFSGDKPGEQFVIGLSAIERWLASHKTVIRSDENAPTGILLVGVPGTGKSATAKEVSRQLELPLVRLDMSKILGRYVGDSEKGMQEMLEDLRFVAPCVLWIDEIEKAMSGADGKSDGSGVIQRLFGMLLTFIQENDRPVFTVTTANDISRLPPEFFRNGRFNQAFCLMMPNYRECCEIMKLKLNQYARRQNWECRISPSQAGLILDECLGTPDCPRFLTGADIEAHVQELFWYYKEHSVTKCPEPKALRNDMRNLAALVRAQASPCAPQTMDDLAARYLDMMRRGLTMAGDEKTPYVGKNLRLERVQYASFDENEPDTRAPLCIELPEEFKHFAEFENVQNAVGKEPSAWYDARFFYELTNAMYRVLIMDQRICLDYARKEYWKRNNYLYKKKSEL